MNTAISEESPVHCWPLGGYRISNGEESDLCWSFGYAYAFIRYTGGVGSFYSKKPIFLRSCSILTANETERE
ncbi:hypothetical protein EVAR_58078_1 [Eumeta japonica]|uniref:Uncharacterized protein n=1 Tax=Eumeta variegata TaxID=151549 RepID=A0A4C1ZEH3_EUMVA|nr:hypothetical protein EVAR_58078_1 [Eumeta japonica]